MGIDINGAQVLIRAFEAGVSFERVATLGRQGLYGDRRALVDLFRKHRIAVPDADRAALLHDDYSEGFFRLLGAKFIASIDASAYEGATIVHDLNCPIPDELTSAFSCVVDCGTLEHVYHFSVAIASCMRMVKPGGHFLAQTPTNNFSGHGFYQFSPELFYSLLPANGFEVTEVLAWEESRGSHFYSVPDPRLTKSRVEIGSRRPTFLFVMARKQLEPQIETTPQQSDYVTTWGKDNTLNGKNWRVVLTDRIIPRTPGLRNLYAQRAAWRRRLHRFPIVPGLRVG